jgi:capsular polysaccharide biosynthesis protein
MSKATDTLAGLAWRGLLIAAPVVACALAGLWYADTAKPVYTAKAYVAVVAVNPGDSNAAVSYAQAFARIVPQGDVVSAAVAASKNTISPDDLRRRIRASASPDAPVVEITAEGDTPIQAANLANTMASGLLTAARTHTATTRMSLTPLSAAVPPTEPTSPKPMLSAAVGAATGLILGALLARTGVGAAADRLLARRALGRARRRDKHAEPTLSPPPRTPQTIAGFPTQPGQG